MSKIVTVNLPDIGEGVVEGEVVEWLKKLQDPLKQDEPVVIVMTDKATVELPAPCPGKLVKQYFAPGQIAIKDKPLYDIETSEEIKIQEHIKKPDMPPASAESIIPIATRPPSTPSTHVKSSPHTRKIAKELGINIENLHGSGPEGRVTPEDLKQSLQRNKVASTLVTRLPGDKEEPLIGIKSLMAKKMAEANDQIPHFSYFESCDATRLVQLRERYKQEGAKQKIAVTYLPFIIKALSLTLREFPYANSSVDQTAHSIIIHEQHNIGIAMNTKQGLIVPVLKNVQQMGIEQIIHTYEELKNKAAQSNLKPIDMKEGTITISNFGVLGGHGMWATPIINFPEVAILGLARIHKEPVARNNTVVLRDILNLSWSFDHRVIDGDQAASISNHFSGLLQNPAALI